VSMTVKKTHQAASLRSLYGLVEQIVDSIPGGRCRVVKPKERESCSGCSTALNHASTQAISRAPPDFQHFPDAMRALWNGRHAKCCATCAAR